MHAKLSGKFKVYGVDSQGREHLLRDWTDNLITDIGLDMLATIPSGKHEWNYAAHIGTGTTPPAVTDTGLETETHTTDERTIYGGARAGSIGLSQMGWIYVFDAQGTDYSFTELGVGNELAGGNVFNRAVIDEVTVVAGLSLHIIYILATLVSLEDTIYTATINGTTTNCTTRVANFPEDANITPSPETWLMMSTADHITHAAVVSLTAFSTPIVATTAQPPSSGIIASGGPVTIPYTPGSYLVEFDSTLLDGTGTILSLVVKSAIGSWQTQFDPPLELSSADVQYTTRISWGRSS